MAKSGVCKIRNNKPPAIPIISPRIRIAPVSAPSPAPRACAARPDVPIRKKPKNQ
jgi:hypothetical protein